MRWFSKSVPGGEHESCSKLIHALEERVAALELGTAEQHMQVLATAEKVAHALEERSRKRQKQNGGEEPGKDPVVAELQRRLVERRLARGF